MFSCFNRKNENAIKDEVEEEVPKTEEKISTLKAKIRSTPKFEEPKQAELPPVEEQEGESDLSSRKKPELNISYVEE